MTGVPAHIASRVTSRMAPASGRHDRDRSPLEDRSPVLHEPEKLEPVNQPQALDLGSERIRSPLLAGGDLLRSRTSRPAARRPAVRQPRRAPRSLPPIQRPTKATSGGSCRPGSPCGLGSMEFHSVTTWIGGSGTASDDAAQTATRQDEVASEKWHESKDPAHELRLDNELVDVPDEPDAVRPTNEPPTSRELVLTMTTEGSNESTSCLTQRRALSRRRQ